MCSLWFVGLLCALYYSAACSRVTAGVMGCELCSLVVISAWMLIGVLRDQPYWIEAAVVAQILSVYVPLFWLFKKH